jgi:hypothetical protein
LQQASLHARAIDRHLIDRRADNPRRRYRDVCGPPRPPSF